MEPVEPIERVGREHIGNFAPAKIVDCGVPVRMVAAARIGVFIERGTIETREAMNIRREMRRNPINDNAEASLVSTIDEARETRRISEPPRWREQSDRLIAPRRIERMFVNGHQLDMGEAEIGDIRDERVGEFLI